MFCGELLERRRYYFPPPDMNTVIVIMREGREVGREERGEGEGRLEAAVGSVGTVDLCVDWVVGVSNGEDAIVGVRQDRGQGG